MAELRVQMSRRCCSWPVQPVSTQGAHWRLYVLVDAIELPTHRWEGKHRRHVTPTAAEREQALAELGYRLVEGAAWEWTEHEPDLAHGHHPRVLLIATALVEPIPEEGS